MYKKYFMPLEIAKKLWTVDEVLRMQEAGILPPDNRLELIHGELIEMSPSGSKHAAAVNRIHLLFVELLGRKAIIWGQTSVLFDPYSAPEPDIAILRYRDDFYEKQLPGPEDILLVIEVSDSTLAFDQTIKASLYAEFNIPEYWILNLQEFCVERYQQPGTEGYVKKKVFSKNEILAVPGVGLEVSVGQLLGL